MHPAHSKGQCKRLLRGLHWKICLVYLDNVIIYSHSFNPDHIGHLRQVFDKFREANLKLNSQFDGSQFIVQTDASTKGLGFVLSQEQDGETIVIAYGGV